MENIKDLEASCTFFSSPIESINLNPENIIDITARTTENDITKSMREYKKSERFSKPVLLRKLKSMNMQFLLS